MWEQKKTSRYIQTKRIPHLLQTWPKHTVRSIKRTFLEFLYFICSKYWLIHQPQVRIYTAEGVMAELEKSKSEYLQASVVVTTTKRIQVPELLLRNMVDFAKDANSLIEWICLHLPASGSLRKSIVDCYRSQTTGRIVDKIPYDYEFGYLLVV